MFGQGCFFDGPGFVVVGACCVCVGVGVVGALVVGLVPVAPGAVDPVAAEAPAIPAAAPPQASAPATIVAPIIREIRILCLPSRELCSWET
jgi:hypothetical protein